MNSWIPVTLSSPLELAVLGTVLGAVSKGIVSCPSNSLLCFLSPFQLSILALGACLSQEKVSQLLGFRATFGIADQRGSP